MGSVELYLINDEGGTWEEQWRDFQGIWDLPVISKTDMDHALHGWTKPLVTVLGPPPKGKLIQLPQAAKKCASEKTCPFYDKRTCGASLKKMPWCFVPDDTKAGSLAAEVIKLWREGVYVLVVQEPKPDGANR
jgi:hypothetical protein